MAIETIEATSVYVYPVKSPVKFIHKDSVSDLTGYVQYLKYLYNEKLRATEGITSERQKKQLLGYLQAQLHVLKEAIELAEQVLERLDG